MRAKYQSPLNSHQELAYWTTLCPNPALSMRKVVGLSVSKLKQTEEAKAGEEGEERSFGEGSSSFSISQPQPPFSFPGPMPQCLLVFWTPRLWLLSALLLSFG